MGRYAAGPSSPVAAELQTVQGVLPPPRAFPRPMRDPEVLHPLPHPRPHITAHSPAALATRIVAGPHLTCLAYWLSYNKSKTLMCAPHPLAIGRDPPPQHDLDAHWRNHLCFAG